MHKAPISIVGLAGLFACAGVGLREGRIVKQPFGTTADGEPVHLYQLVNANGLEARITDYGATLVQLKVPDREGELADVVLGFEDVSGYQSEDNQYFGCTTGRVCNRIAKGRFVLEGQEYRLPVNNGPNHLHGGVARSLDKVVWQAVDASGTRGPAVRFRFTSPHMDEGYPGNLDLTVTYTLTDENELWIDYFARTDRPTPVNLTNHTYWNLHGHGKGTTLDHELKILAGRYTPTDDTLIPTGAIATVEGRPLDFQRPTAVGARIDALRPTPARGYDHNYVLFGEAGTLRVVARLYDPSSGRGFEVLTTEPGLQLYSGNFLAGQPGKGGREYVRNGGLCLETQHFPDSVNQPEFPSILLRPGEEYRTTTGYRFFTR